MPIALIAAALTGLISILLFIGLVDTQNSQQQVDALKTEIQHLEFKQLFMQERGLEPPPEIQQQLVNLKNELKDLQAKQQAARQQYIEDAEEIRQGIRSTYSSQENKKENE